MRVGEEDPEFAFWFWWMGFTLFTTRAYPLKRVLSNAFI
jgi:hypothetical protein